MTKILKIPLPDRIQPVPIRFLRVEMAAGHIAPFALVRYALDGKEEELGLRLDLDKRAFLDHFDQQDVESACREAAPRIVEYLGSTPAANNAPPNGDQPARNADRPGGRRARTESWKLAAVWRRLGVGTKRFLVECADYLKDHPSFTFSELAQATGSEQSACALTTGICIGPSRRKGPRTLSSQRLKEESRNTHCRLRRFTSLSRWQRPTSPWPHRDRVKRSSSRSPWMSRG